MYFLNVHENMNSVDVCLGIKYNIGKKNRCFFYEIKKRNLVVSV